MSRALEWIRKSKGDEDDIGLEEQRELVGALADDVADESERLDLGVHTGFSTMTRDDPAGLLDQNERVEDAVDALAAGEYEYLVALDDRRICRDEYFSVIQYACNQGNCEIVYCGDVNEDDLTFDLKRRIERDTKEEEIEKARRAIERKKERGDDLGRPRFGMEYDDGDPPQQVPGDEFETVLKILRMKSKDMTYAQIEEATGVSKATISRVVNRREWYVERSQLADQ